MVLSNKIICGLLADILNTSHLPIFLMKIKQESERICRLNIYIQMADKIISGEGFNTQQGLYQESIQCGDNQ
jgi:hypothetical protein